MMTVIELNAQKMEIIEMLLAVDDEKTVADILSYVRKSKKAPCAYTSEEVRRRLAKAEVDIVEGRYLPHEAIERKSVSR